MRHIYDGVLPVTFRNDTAEPIDRQNL